MIFLKILLEVTAKLDRKLCGFKSAVPTRLRCPTHYECCVSLQQSLIVSSLLKKFHSFPIMQTVGANLDGYPVLCGGLTRKGKAISKCYLYNNESTWQELSDVGAALRTHRGITIKNVLYIQSNARLFSVHLNSSVTTVARLPMKLSHSCLVNLNSTKIGIIGGVNDKKYLDELLLYDLDSKAQWMILPLYCA